MLDALELELQKLPSVVAGGLNHAPEEHVFLLVELSRQSRCCFFVFVFQYRVFQ